MAGIRKKTAAEQLSRLAKETGNSKAPPQPTPPIIQNADSKLEALLRNVGRVVMIPLKEITLSENVRKYVPTDTPEFEQLVDSIRLEGLLQNLIAELEVDGKTYALNLVSGQRRYIAAERVGLDRCPVLITQYTTRGSRIARGLAENVLRDNLHCLDLAEGYAELLNEGWSEEEVALTFDRRRQTIMQHLRLARYPQEARQIIRDNPERFSSYDLLNKFVAHRWKNDEDLILALKKHIEEKQVKRPQKETETNLLQRGRELSQKSGYRVGIAGTKEAGKITINWVNSSQCESLFKLLDKMPKLK